MKILVGTGTSEKDDKTKGNFTETNSEGDDVSLIGDLNGEINECLQHGISNVAHGGEVNSARKINEGTITVSHGTTIEEISHL